MAVSFLEKVLLIMFYGVNLWYFYYEIVWSESYRIKEICSGYYSCNRHLYLNLLEWEVDLADSQWRSFRNALSMLIPASFGISIVSYLILYFDSDINKSSVSYWRLLVGLIILFIQHKYHSLIVIFLTWFGYVLVNLFAGSYFGGIVIWMYAIFILLFKESYRIMHYPSYQFLIPFFHQQRWGGMHGWQYAANFLILRFISFGMDVHWHRLKQQFPLTKIASSSSSAAAGSPTLSSKEIERKKMMITLSSISYFSYMFYAPLYLAGPILNYQDYLLSTTHYQTKVSILIYGLRWILLFVLMEWFTAHFHVFGLLQANLLIHLPIYDIAIIAYILLKTMWLKFTTLWRFFRWWSLADGIYVEENMQRCMSNNFSLEEFWRGWHTSYNKWIIRYLYIPLGGKETRWISVWFIFLFVALWHDFEWKLILWGLLNGVFFIIEITSKSLYRKYIQPLLLSQLTSGSNRQDISLWITWLLAIIDHLICAIAGAAYIMVLMLINLVGYALGTNTIPLIQEKLFSRDGLVTMVGGLYFLAVGVSIMMQLRYFKLCKK
jgi:protein-cysteine N-palmitoyltransferase HHAT